MTTTSTPRPINTKTEYFDLAVPFTKPFETYDEFELFIFSNGIGFTKDTYEDFIEWCAEKYEDIFGEDIFEKM